jgi:hypothetical protein
LIKHKLRNPKYRTTKTSHRTVPSAGLKFCILLVMTGILELVIVRARKQKATDPTTSSARKEAGW